MMYTFKSCFASQIEDFIAQKNALGFGYLESSRLLRDFDRVCLTHFPEENTLTKELCLAWATKKDTEGNNTFRNRMMPVREFLEKIKCRRSWINMTSCHQISSGT